MAGERVLELCDALLEAHDLLPQPISLGRDRNDTFSHLRDVVLPAKSFTALSLDGTVGAHSLSVGGPLARPTGTVLSHAHHLHVRLSINTLTHMHLGFVYTRDCPYVSPGYLPGPGQRQDSAALTEARTNLRSMLVGPSVL